MKREVVKNPHLPGESMSEQQWEVVDSVAGEIRAELLRGLLAAQGIPAYLSQEGAGHFGYAVTIGELGKVDILVPSSLAQAARAVLEAYYAGEFTLNDESAEEMGEENAEEGETPPGNKPESD
jgi:hypothetical protein